MSIKKILFLAAFLYKSTGTDAQNINDAQVVAAKAWWHAFYLSDTNYIKTNSTNELTVTYPNGRSFSLKQLNAQIGNPDPKITSEWYDINMQMPNPQTAIITNRVIEAKGTNTGIFKFITVLVQVRSKWKIAAVQSTRFLELSPRVSESLAGKLEDYSGKYRTPSGAILSVVVRDTSLVIVDPSGGEAPLEAIGPGLFEPPTVPYIGNVRIFFSRDATGRVTSLNRVTNNVITMTRIQ